MTLRDDHDEERLVERAQAGEAGAFEEIVRRYEDRIYRFGYRMCGHREDARDVLQDTFLAALRHLPGYRGDGRLVGWLFKIASSACLKKRRKKKDEPSHFLSLEDRQREDGTPLVQLIRSPAPSPDEEAQREELRRRLHAAVMALPEHYRIVVVLRDFEHLSTKEVADTLGLTVTAAKVRLHRARLMLRETLKETRVAGDS